MTIHTIVMPDWMRGRELRTVIWDDEAGTVSGDHYDVRWLREMLAKPTPLMLYHQETEPLALHDPAHDAGEFLALLGEAYWPILDWDRDRHRLPPALRDVQLPKTTRRKVYEILPDGSRGRELEPGTDFVY